MTVIIAGLYGNGEGAVIVADRMKTIEHPFMDGVIEVDHEELVKITKLTQNAYVAFSGEQEFWSEVIKDAAIKIHLSDKSKKIRRILEVCYQKQFRRFLDAQVLVPLGFDSIKDYNKRANDELSPTRIAQIDEQLKKKIGNEELVLVSFENGLYEIYGLRDPGYFQLNIEGQAIVGSGARSATKPVVENHRKSMKKETVKMILIEAKKLAERDKGVGALTQIVCLPEE
jgi:20S proteasome alpha/beta subunit